MKKHIFIGYIIGFISCCVILSLVLYVLSMPKKEEIKFAPAPEGFAVMIYDEEKQDYIESDGLPIGGYILNSEKSYCTNGGTIDKYNPENGSVEYSVEGTDECVMYLDTGYTINITSSNASYGTVSPSIQTAKSGSSVSIIINPLSGYKYSSNTCGGTVSGNELIINNIQSNITCSVNFERIYYYAFGLPTISSPTDYTKVGYNVFIRDDTPDETTRELCIVRTDVNPGLHCFQNNNYEYEQSHLQKVINDGSCKFGTDYLTCYVYNIDDFSCTFYKNGSVYCNDNNWLCEVTYNGFSSCQSGGGV